MPAVEHHLNDVIEGSVYEVAFGWATDADEMIPLTIANGGTADYEARMQVRRRRGDTGTPYISLTSDPAVGLWVDQTPGGEPDPGWCWVRIPPSHTIAMVAAGATTGEYDVEVFNPADAEDIHTLGYGDFKVRKQVTLP